MNAKGIPMPRRGGGMQVHAVPEGERAFDANGQRLPWAYEYNDPDRAQRRVPEERGPFGRATTRRGSSRSKTFTPQSKKEDKDSTENWKVIDDIFNRVKADERAREASARDSNSDAVAQPTATTQMTPAGKPTEVILYGYAAAFQYAAIEFYERVSGGAILEDYDRFPPHSKYDLSLSLNRSRAAATLSQEALRMRNKYHGGEHWIKVTFDSAEAAERACLASPHVLNGHLVYSEPYRSAPPAADEAIPATEATRHSATTSPSQKSSTTMQNPLAPSSDTATSATVDNPSSILTPTPLPRNQLQSSLSGSGRQLISATSASTAVSTTTTSALPTPKPLRIRGAKPAVLLPAEQALLPSRSRWQQTFGALPVVRFFLGGGSSDFIGNELPCKEDGSFDWQNAGLYWRFWASVDYYIGTDFCGLKGDGDD